MSYDALPGRRARVGPAMRARLLRRRARRRRRPARRHAARRAGRSRRQSAGEPDRPSTASAGAVGRAGQRRRSGTRSITTTSTWRCPAIRRSRSCPACLPSPSNAQSSGRDVIAAFVAGYETACRIGSAMRPGHYDLGFHATGTVGCFGAAAACARLLGLDAEATARALGIAGTQAAGLKSQFGTMCKPFHAGKASQNGLLAARLAARGFSSRPDLVECEQGFALTHGPDFRPEMALADPPDGFHILANLFKYHAACYLTHGPIETARAVRDRARRRARADRARHLEARPQLRPGLQHPGPDRRSRSRSSACARPSRWRWPASILRALPPTAPRPPTTRALMALREKVVLDFQDGWPQAAAEIEVALTDGRRAARRATTPAFRAPTSRPRANGSPRNSTRWPSRSSAPPAPANCAARSRTSTRLADAGEIGRLAAK